ncbi:MAG: hypothetical protein OXO50_09175 [Caldilineaceae bacterium]|nr:hypothetical protein [Caldilineaceae bacterium]
MHCDRVRGDSGFLWLAPGTRGRHAAFVSNTVTTESQAILIGEKTPQQAVDDAKALIVAQLAKP